MKMKMFYFLALSAALIVQGFQEDLMAQYIPLDKSKVIDFAAPKMIASAYNPKGVYILHEPGGTWSEFDPQPVGRIHA